MLEALNDDCWLDIIKYLKLEDQIALYEATKGVLNRVNSNVVYAWEHQICFTFNYLTYEKFEQMPELMDIFLSSINATVQKLKLEMVTVEFLKRWENYTFPSMETLEYTFEEWDTYLERGNATILIVAKLFPGLSSLKPYGGINSDLLPNWPQLRKLDLSKWTPDYYGFYLPENLKKCPQLEELIVSDSFRWPQYYDELMALPKLHTFTFCLYDCDDELRDQLLEKCGKEIHTIIFNSCVWEFSSYLLHKMSNLRRMTLLEHDVLTTDEFCELFGGFKQLEHIDLIDHCIRYGEAEFWQIVASCPSLKVLNISGINLNDDFFSLDRLVMNDTLNNRSQPLTLHYHNS
ncbi:hypothetical protein KR044_009336, partial [Drosophila immigrans]